MILLNWNIFQFLFLKSFYHMLSSYIKIMMRGFHQISICFTNICFICTSISNGHVQVSQFEHPRGRTYSSLSEKFGRYEIFVKENCSERRMFYQALLSDVCTYYSIGLLEFCRSFPNWAEYIVNGPITNSFRTYPSEARIAELCSICNALERNRDDLFFPLFVESSHYPLSTRLLDVDHS